MAVVLFPYAGWVNPISEGPNAVPSTNTYGDVPRPGDLALPVFRAETTVFNPLWLLLGLAAVVLVLRER